MSGIDHTSGYSAIAESYKVMSEVLVPAGIAPQSIGVMHAGFYRHYARVCGETQIFQSSAAGTVAKGARDVDGRFAQVAGKYMSGRFFDFKAHDVSYYVEDFGANLNPGDCPDGSMTRNLMDETARIYRALGQKFEFPAASKIVAAVEAGDVRIDDLKALIKVANTLALATDPKESLAFKLLGLVASNNYVMPPDFAALAEELVWGFDPVSWSGSLQSVAREVTLATPPNTINDDWQVSFADGVRQASGAHDASVRSLLTLLHWGLKFVVRKILYFFRAGTNSSIRRSLEIFLHVFAARNPSEKRLFLMDQIMKIVQGAYRMNNVSYPELVDPLVALVAFEESSPEAEAILGKMVERIIAFRKKAPEDVQMANTVLVFAKYLKDLYVRLLREGLNDDQRREAAANSIVVKALKVAEFVRFNSKYLLDIERTLRMSDARAEKKLHEIVERFINDDEESGGGRSGGSLSGLPPPGGILPPVPSVPFTPRMSEYDSYWDGSEEIMGAFEPITAAYGDRYRNEEEEVEGDDNGDYYEDDFFLNGAEVFTAGPERCFEAIL